MKAFNMYGYVKKLDEIRHGIEDAIDVGSDTGMMTAEELDRAKKQLNLCAMLTDAALRRRTAFLPDIRRFVKQYA